MAAAYFSSGASAAAGDNAPPLYVTVEGEQMSYTDVLQLTGMVLNAVGIMKSAVVKPPEQMPKNAPYVSYIGKDDAGKPIIWISSAVNTPSKHSDAENAEIQHEQLVASMLAMLDMGKGTSKWHRLYEKMKSNPARLPALGNELSAAMTGMSKKTVEYSAVQRRWMFANIHAGTPSAQVYELLKAHGLVATRTSRDAVVSLPGAFEPGCYFSIDVIISFDASGRVYKLDLSQPKPDCL